jgi:hypothetical protein
LRYKLGVEECPFRSNILDVSNCEARVAGF